MSLTKSMILQVKQVPGENINICLLELVPMHPFWKIYFFKIDVDMYDYWL